MSFPVPATALSAWVTSVLAGFSYAGTAIIVGLFVATGVLATRCKGCCREDEIFRLHVV